VSIEVRNLRKSFGHHVALDDVSLTVRPGELVALLGPSGSGKTTLLRVIAGLEVPDAGSVLLDGADAGNRGAADRRVGFVFQHYALFRHLSVFENVAFGLRVRPRARRPAEAEIRRRVHELLSLVQLDYLGERRPSELSGGQRQRVALARALAVEPGVLLLDEPFGALDARVRLELRRWLRRLHGEMRLTSVFVTHDQEEALELADRVVVMNEGRIEQDGTPDAVVDHPASAFVMTFVGQVNVFRGRFQHDAVLGYCRPHELEISRADRGDGLWATVADARVAGAVARMELHDSEGGVIQVELGREAYTRLAAEAGERVYVTPRRLRVFPPGGQPAGIGGPVRGA
jgi:sulfate/thiosulfate transport system ATP-binding protein